MQSQQPHEREYPVTITSEGAGDGNPPINLPPSNQKPKHNSVVPQLMDIYDDLAQSSTPQTTNISSVPLTQAPSTMGDSGNLSLDSNSPTSERSTRRSSGSQSPHTAAEADASSATSVALARARRTKATFKADLEEHHGGKQPARKKGKVSSADNRWSKRFAWPDEVSTGHSTVLCGGLIASVQLIISVNTLTVPPPLLMPAYLNLTATLKFRIRHFRCRPQACKSFHHPGIHDAKPRHYK